MRRAAATQHVRACPRSASEAASSAASDSLRPRWRNCSRRHRKTSSSASRSGRADSDGVFEALATPPLQRTIGPQERGLRKLLTDHSHRVHAGTQAAPLSCLDPATKRHTRAAPSQGDDRRGMLYALPLSGARLRLDLQRHSGGIQARDAGLGKRRAAQPRDLWTKHDDDARSDDHRHAIDEDRAARADHCR